jgi:hypothetical protein
MVMETLNVNGIGKEMMVVIVDGWGQGGSPYFQTIGLATLLYANCGLSMMQTCLFVDQHC